MGRLERDPVEIAHRGTDEPLTILLPRGPLQVENNAYFRKEKYAQVDRAWNSTLFSTHYGASIRNERHIMEQISTHSILVIDNSASMLTSDVSTGGGRLLSRRDAVVAAMREGFIKPLVRLGQHASNMRCSMLKFERKVRSCWPQ